LREEQTGNDERLREEQTGNDERLREDQTGNDERLREDQTGNDERLREEQQADVACPSAPLLLLAAVLGRGWLCVRLVGAILLHRRTYKSVVAPATCGADYP
jgi:hypothetical protein